MSRLTKRNYPNRRLTELRKNGLLKIDLSYSHVEAITNKLADYEDLEEQGCIMVNTDRIVEQLEEESWSVGCSFAPKENRTAIIKTEKAIEIVKGGAK